MNELSALLGKQQVNMVQVFDQINQQRDEKGVSTFQVRGLIAELYRKTGKVKVCIWVSYVPCYIYSNESFQFISQYMY